MFKSTLLKILALGCAGIYSIPTHAGAIDFYISPDGNDQWSGRTPSPDKGKKDGPFATLERVSREIRNLKAKQRLPKEGVRVLLKG